jgi:hypothetical protein
MSNDTFMPLFSQGMMVLVIIIFQPGDSAADLYAQCGGVTHATPHSIKDKI